MLKNISAILFACLICASIPSTASAQDLGGGIGFSRCVLRDGSGAFTTLNNPTPGLHVTVPIDKEVVNSDGSLGTWGFEFGVDYIADQDLDISIVSPKIWTNWKGMKLMGGPQLAFVVPGESGGKNLVATETNLAGVNGAARFNASNVPGVVEFGGSWSWRYDGVDELNISEIHLSLVGDF